MKHNLELRQPSCQRKSSITNSAKGSEWIGRATKKPGLGRN